MDLSQLLRAIGLPQAYQAYQQNIGQPFANVAGPFGRGLLGLERPEYGEEQAYRAGQAIGNMPAVSAPVGAFKAAMQAPELLAAIGAIAPKGARKVAEAIAEARILKNAPQDEALEIARQNAVKMLGLPETNTAMDRAMAMGFKESGYTGTNKDFRSYDASQAAGSGSGSREGPLGAWLTDDPRVAQSFAEWSSRGQGGDVIYPLMIRGDIPYEPTSYAEIKEILDANTKFVRPPYRMMQDKIDYEAAKKALENKGDYVALRNTMTDAIDRPITQYLIPDTSRLRSRFAAFDPARIDAKDLLASLAAMGIALPVGMGLLSEQTD